MALKSGSKINKHTLFCYAVLSKLLLAANNPPWFTVAPINHPLREKWMSYLLLKKDYPRLNTPHTRYILLLPWFGSAWNRYTSYAMQNTQVLSRFNGSIRNANHSFPTKRELKKEIMSSLSPFAQLFLHTEKFPRLSLFDSWPSYRYPFSRSIISFFAYLARLA